MKKLKTFTVEFFDTMEAENIKEVYECMLHYLETCVKYEDLEGFKIEESK